MADKEKSEKVHINIDEIENGFEVSCWREKKPSLSKRAGWVPSSYESPKKYSFDTLDKALAHVRKEADKK